MPGNSEGGMPMSVNESFVVGSSSPVWKLAMRTIWGEGIRKRGRYDNGRYDFRWGALRLFVSV